MVCVKGKRLRAITALKRKATRKYWNFKLEVQKQWAGVDTSDTHNWEPWKKKMMIDAQKQIRHMDKWLEEILSRSEYDE